KVSILSRLISVPPVEQLDAFYEAMGVNRPPASPASSVVAILVTFRDMVEFLVLPSYGTLAMVLLVSVSVLALGGLTALYLCSPRSIVQVLARCGVVGVRRA